MKKIISERDSAVKHASFYSEVVYFLALLSSLSFRCAEEWTSRRMGWTT